MAHAYSTRSEARGSGIPPDRWCSLHIATLPCNKLNTDTIAAINSYGDSVSIPRGRAALLFKDLKIVQAEQRANHGGCANSVSGTSVTVVDLQEAMYALFDLKTHRLVKKGDTAALVPLYYAEEGNKICTGQCSAQWVGCGDPFKLAYHEHNSTLMYMQAIQSVIWELANESSKARVTELAERVSLLVQAARAFFTANPAAAKVIEPLRDADDAIDCLGRSCAFIFFDQPWESETFIRIMEISLKRWRKHIKDNRPGACDFVLNAPYGVYAIALMIDPLRALAQSTKSLRETCDTINTRTMGLITLLAENIGERGPALNKRVLGYLCPSLPVEGVNKLYDYCVEPGNLNTLAPLGAWGLVPEASVPFEFGTTGKVNGRDTKFTTKLKPSGANSFVVTSTQPSEWAPFTLSTPGIYNMRGSVQGAAEAGQGNTVGKTNTAILRFVSGFDVMPAKGKPGEGKGSTGMHYRLTGGRWDYVNSGDTLAVESDFTLTIRRDGSFEVRQNGRCWFELPGPRNLQQEPCCLGLKFMKLTMSYTPLPADVPVVIAQPPAPPPVNAPSSGAVLVQDAPAPDISGLTGVALLKELQKLALADKAKPSPST